MWKQLTIDDLRLILSETEAKQLETSSLNADITSVIDSTIDLIADTWRGAFAAKGYTLDIRPHYSPSSYSYYILVHARHAIWTRFPFSTDIALDERRTQEYEKAMELLKDPYLNVDPVTEEEGKEDKEEIGTGSGSIRVPLQRFSNWYLDNTAQETMLSNYI